MPAQGSIGNYTGPREFFYHAVVRVGAYPDRIYDPSYGSVIAKADGKTVELTYEDETITDLWDGWLWNPDPKPGANLLVGP